MKIEGFGGVKFWINRMTKEHNIRAKKEIEKASTLNFQLFNFDKMREEVQEKVIEDLFSDIKNCFGEEEYNRIKEEYFKEDVVEDKS